MKFLLIFLLGLFFSCDSPNYDNYNSQIIVSQGPPIAPIEMPINCINGIYVPGHFTYSYGRYNWIPGYCDLTHSGQIYIPGRYNNGRWYNGGWTNSTTYRERIILNQPSIIPPTTGRPNIIAPSINNTYKSTVSVPTTGRPVQANTNTTIQRPSVITPTIGRPSISSSSNNSIRTSPTISAPSIGRPSFSSPSSITSRPSITAPTTGRK